MMVCKMRSHNLLKLCSSSIHLNQFRCVNFLFTYHHHLTSRLNLSSYTSIASKVVSPALSEGLVILDEPTTFMSSYSPSSASIFSQKPLNFTKRRGDRLIEINSQVDEKFRLLLRDKTPSQMVETVRAFRHLIDVVRLRTFIRQLAIIGPIYSYHLLPEQFEFIHEMLRSFPEMTSDLNNLSDLSCLVSQIRISSETPLLQYIAREVVKKIDEMSLNEAFEFYKSFQVLKIEPENETMNPEFKLSLLKDDVVRARYQLISNIAFRIETSHFDQTDLLTLCEIFRRINKEFYAKEAIDILVKSIYSTISYMRSKNATDVIAGFTSTYGSKIVKEVFTSGNKQAIKMYSDLIDLSILTTGKLTNAPAGRLNMQSSRYISECFTRMLLREGDQFSQPSFWKNFLGEIDFNRHKLDLHGWQNLLTLVNRFRIYCPFIIDTIAPIVIQDAQAYIQNRHISPIPYIRLMAECYHKPMTVNWDKFLNVLLHPKKILESPADRTLSLLSRLAVLEDYSKIRDFDIDCIKSSVVASRNRAQYKRLLTLYSGLIQETDNSNQKWSIKKDFAPLVSKAIICLDKDSRLGALSSLQTTLEAAFGGPEFVINGVWTKSGIFMTHLLVLRRGEYPVAIRNADDASDSKFTYLNEISIPPEAKVVTVFPIYRYYYSYHSTNLRGKIQFKIRLLRKLGIIPVIADVSEFDALPVHERTHWLVSKIRTKVTENNSDAWEFWR